MRRIGLTMARIAASAAPLGIASALALTVALAGSASAQPAPMGEAGCCCVTIKDGKIGCGQKSQAECLAEQPKTPLYDKLPDWAKDVAESQKDEAAKMKTGWHAGACPS
jgi:hypothetical protein